MPSGDVRGEIWDLNLIPNLTGKTAIVTGANAPTGIGFHIAHQLALKGAKVYIGARNNQKAQDAILEMRRISPSILPDSLLPLAMDIGNLPEVKKVAEHFVATESRLDILVNNAALVARSLDQDRLGISVSMVTNHLGPFVLTTTLLSLLKNTASMYPGVRIVTVSANSHTMVPDGIRLNSIEALNNELGGTDPANFPAGLSKLANILFTKQLQKKLDAEGIQAVAISLHPGSIRTTGIVNFVGENTSRIDNFLTPLHGSITALFAATAPEVWTEKTKFGGNYLMPYGVVLPDDESPNAKNAALAEELWVTSEKVVEEELNLQLF